MFPSRCFSPIFTITVITITVTGGLHKIEIRKKNFQRVVFWSIRFIISIFEFGWETGIFNEVSKGLRLGIRGWNQSTVNRVSRRSSSFGRYRSTSCVRIAKSDTEGNCEEIGGQSKVGVPHLRGLSLAIRVIIATRRYDSTGFLPFPACFSIQGDVTT